MKVLLRVCFFLLVVNIVVPCVRAGTNYSSATAVKLSPFACLPDNTKLTDIVTYGRTRARSVTVKAKLTQIGARCRKSKLIDASGRQIHFYQLQGCWGNPPADHLEILQTQAKEIAVLKKKYRVIELACDPAGVI